MPEETTTPVAQEQAQGQEQAKATPAVANTTETQAEQTVPYTRFKEINDKLKALEDDAAKQAKERAAEDERKLAESAEWQKLADKRKATLEELTPKAELADRLTELVAAQYDTEIKDWPEQVKAMAPGDDASILVKLEWMQKAKPLALELLGEKAPVPGNGTRPKPVARANAGKETEAQIAEWRKKAVSRYR